MRETVIIDTNVVIALFDGDCALAEALFSAERVLVPAIVCGEIDVGSHGDTKRERNARAAFETFLSLPMVTVLPVTRATGAHYAAVHAFCRRNGRPIPTNDMWIAALALERDSVVLTRDSHLLNLSILKTRLV